MADRCHPVASKAAPPRSQFDPAHPEPQADSAPAKTRNACAGELAESDTPIPEKDRQGLRHPLAPPVEQTIHASVDTPPAAIASSRRSSSRSAAFQHRSAG